MTLMISSILLLLPSFPVLIIISVDCDDDLEWSLYYYAGAAKVAGQAYIGAVLATKDGKWPGQGGAG